MPLYTLQIKQKPIMIFWASRLRSAKYFVSADDIAMDVAEKLHDGRPIWDGQEQFNFRKSWPNEILFWNAEIQKLKDEKVFSDDFEKEMFFYLIDISSTRFLYDLI